MVPIGIAGELCIGGAGVARGYLNQRRLTAERFVPNPFSEAGGERMYRTGDLVRWREEGELEFLGRVDHQVKLRGYRIELGEIEATLNGHPGVKQSVVVARGEEAEGKRLIGYVVGREEESVSVEELRSYLREKLPDYLVPSRS